MKYGVIVDNKVVEIPQHLYAELSMNSPYLLKRQSTNVILLNKISGLVKINCK